MIGVFDSGLGGLTVVRALRRLRPDLPFVYLGDTARTPYGTKGQETVQRYADEATAFLRAQGAQAVIIACNTASALAAEHLRASNPDFPIFEVIQPAVEAALAVTKNGKIGVMATRSTTVSGAYEARLKMKRSDIEVVSQAAPLLVPLVEEGWLDTPETSAIVGKYVAPLRDAGIDTLILGCTHYPMLKAMIAARAGEGIRLIDSAEAAAQAFCDKLDADATLSAAVMAKGATKYFVTDRTPAFVDIASAWLGEPITVSLTTL